MATDRRKIVNETTSHFDFPDDTAHAFDDNTFSLIDNIHAITSEIKTGYTLVLYMILKNSNGKHRIKRNTVETYNRVCKLG